MIDKRDERATINLTVDKGIKERALKVLESQGMTMSGAVKAMVRISIRQSRIPFEVTREPEVAGIGMRDDDAEFYGIAKDGTDGRSGIPSGMTIWVLMELFSFGSFIDLYLFCAEYWGDREMVYEHYMLRQAKSVRNACAHSSDVLNGVVDDDARIGADAAVMRALAEAGLSHRVRTTKMKNPRTRQIATLVYLHMQLAPEGSKKKSATSNPASLKKKLFEMSDLAPANDAIRSTVSFLAKLIDSWFR